VADTDEDTRLREAIKLVRNRLKDLAPVTDPVQCVAEGRIRSAYETLRQAANMVGEE
jgi:hypothetical protein